MILLPEQRFCNRREFLSGLAGLAVASRPVWGAAAAEGGETEAARQRLWAAHRPSAQAQLPPDFRSRVGATHVDGKYHLTREPFLLEGARKLLELGTRLGKFWFLPESIARSYPYNSRWGEYSTLLDLARADYFQQLFALPFATLFLEAHARSENAWLRPDQPARFYETLTQEYYEVAAYWYKTFRERDLTIVLQHWEGDWLLRGKGGATWNPPPDDWRRRCESMQRWLQARQAGVAKARQEYGQGARLRVAHAAEVNRVADLWKGIPTMTQHVLPGVELDLISYSCYDGLASPGTLWKCLAEIRKYARTGPLFGPGAVCVGEIGIPENDQPEKLVDRWDEYLGVLLAAKVSHIIHWELYCNEYRAQAPKPPPAVVTDPAACRGFWLVKPDGSLSQSGRYLHALWQRAKT